MELPEVQPLLRISSILQWLVVVLIFFAGTLQIAKIFIDQRIDSTRKQRIEARVQGYETTIAELRMKEKPQPERKAVTASPTKGRHVPAHMIAQVKEELSRFEGASVRLACDRNDKEALFFAEQLKALFKEAGWGVSGVNQTQHGDSLKEVVIVVNHEGQKQKANYVFSLLMALDVQSSARLNRNQQEDLGIVVGRRD